MPEYVPRGEIRLLRGVPLDMSFTHSIYWETPAQQRQVMGQFSAITFQSQMYQRWSKGVLRVECLADSCYECNYLMFNNQPTNTAQRYAQKWFYAFITDIEYINEQVTQITYVIDPIQTWFFEIKNNLAPCYVEREHTRSDQLGEHVLPEPIGCGDYIYDELTLYTQSAETGQDVAVYNSTNLQSNIVICSTFRLNPTTQELEFPQGETVGGLYSGVCVNIFTDAQSANAFLEKATSELKAEGIVCAYMMPRLFAPATTIPTDIISFDTHIYKYGNSEGPQSMWGPGFVPRNNKTYNYPITCLYVLNADGVGAEYKWEDFNTTPRKCEFELKGTTTSKPEVALIPKGYKLSNTGGNYNEMLLQENFPMCTFAIDAFKAWLAQNKARLIVDGTAAGLSVGWGLANIGLGAGKAAATSTMPLGGASIGLKALGGSDDIKKGVKFAAGGTYALARMGADVYTASLMPPHAKGQQSNTLQIANKSSKFRFYRVRAKEEYAREADSFFTMFGYSCKELKTPSLKNRTQYTYIKTIGFQLLKYTTGSGYLGNTMPASELETISQIFDNGITFWSDPTQVGNYNVTNTPLDEVTG